MSFLQAFFIFIFLKSWTSFETHTAKSTITTTTTKKKKDTKGVCVCVCKCAFKVVVSSYLSAGSALGATTGAFAGSGGGCEEGKGGFMEGAAGVLASEDAGGDLLRVSS